MIDENLSWKNHIYTLTTKISKTIGIIAKLRHFVPNRTLLDIYKSLIAPYITYGLTSWGTASKTLLNKVLVLQKLVLRLIHFAPVREHAIPLFLKAKLLPLEFQYYEKIANLMYDINTSSAQLTFQICFPKLPAFILIAHVHQRLSIFTLKNLHLTFKVKPSHTLVLKSGMGYQLVSKTHPRILLKNLLEQN